METKRVVIKGGGSNLYQVTYSSGYYHAYKVNVGIFSNDYDEIGKASSFEDALSIIRSYSGRDIDEISTW